MYSQLIVLSEAVDNRDDEFNDWYSWVHIRDVMRLSNVVVAVQRFRRAAHQLPGGASGKYPQPYLALYENTDPVRMTADHAPVFTADMPISNAYSFNNICEAYYDTVAARGAVAGLAMKTDVIVERIEHGAGGPKCADWYVDQRFPGVMKLPGVVSGFFGREGVHQMFEEGPRSQYTAVYRTTDLPATLKAWQACASLSPVPMKAGDVSVDCYTPQIDRLTAIQVKEPDPVSKETAAKKRAAMGDKVHKGAPNFTGFK